MMKNDEGEKKRKRVKRRIVVGLLVSYALFVCLMLVSHAHPILSFLNKHFWCYQLGFMVYLYLFEQVSSVELKLWMLEFPGLSIAKRFC